MDQSTSPALFGAHSGKSSLASSIDGEDLLDEYSAVESRVMAGDAGDQPGPSHLSSQDPYPLSQPMPIDAESGGTLADAITDLPPLLRLRTKDFLEPEDGGPTDGLALPG